MPDAGTTEHSRDDCNGQQTAPVCHAGPACLVPAILAPAPELVAAAGGFAVPVTEPATLASALIRPDLPPPRA